MEDDIYYLFYDEEENVMMDECGFVITNIFNIISPNALFLFKRLREDLFVVGTHGQNVGLIFGDRPI